MDTPICATCNKPIHGIKAIYKGKVYDKVCFEKLLYELPMTELYKLAKGEPPDSSL